MKRPITFAARLRELREAHDQSQRELADLLGIDFMQISRYERGMGLPSIETAVKIADFFKVGLDDLLIGGAGTLEAPEIRDLKLFEQFRILDKLPREDRETVSRLVSAMIAQRGVQDAMAAAAKTSHEPARGAAGASSRR